MPKPIRNGLIKTSIGIPQDLYWHWIVEVAKRRTTRKVAYEEALRDWIAKGAKQKPRAGTGLPAG